jgi:hypothetical protein
MPSLPRTGREEPMNLLEDKREIEAIYSDEGSWHVGHQNVTSIRCYAEPGQYAPLPWFEICKGTEVVSRQNAAFIETVNYKEAKP